MISQRTLKASIKVTGIGLHSGKPVQTWIKPALPNRGITFVRSDLRESPKIPAFYTNVVNTQLATTLGVGNTTVGTVEHVLAALQGLGIDNAEIHVDGPEVPILDGSSAPFHDAILSAGIQTQLHARSYLELRRRVELQVGEKWAVAEPSSQLEIHASIDWDHPSIGYQEFRYFENSTPFEEVAPARTFGLLRDVEMLKRMGLAKGGALSNAVVLDDSDVINPDGLRFQDEFVRHKVLDALGDIKLAGITIRASVRLHRSGHDLHSQLLNAIFRDPDNYEIVGGFGRREQNAFGVRAAMARALVASVR